jgi:hypothetical protein
MTGHILRLAGLCLLGAAITPLGGYFAGLATGSAVVIWFGAMLFAFAADGLKGGLTMLALPAVLGASWGWPVTCIIFPLAGMAVRGNARTPWLFAAIGVICGAATAYAWIALGLKPLQTGLEQYLAAGALAGFVLGVIFGFVLRRVDAAHGGPAPAPRSS